MTEEVIEMHAIVQGRVQGVGFRWTVSNHASHLGIHGTVRNLPDGSVEIKAQGSRELLDRLVERIKQNAGQGFVEYVSTSFVVPVKHYSSFSIVK